LPDDSTRIPFAQPILERLGGRHAVRQGSLREGHERGIVPRIQDQRSWHGDGPPHGTRLSAHASCSRIPDTPAWAPVARRIAFDQSGDTHEGRGATRHHIVGTDMSL